MRREISATDLAFSYSTAVVARHVRQPVLQQAERPDHIPAGVRRPWMLTGPLGGSVRILVVAAAPSIVAVLVGRCIAQVFFNALLAALVAVARRSGPRRSTAELPVS